ncbi:hypothetical protein D3C86_1720620 [compost metagenome]
MAGNARGAGVEKLSVIEVHGLADAVVEIDLAAATQGPVASAHPLAGFENGHGEAGLAQFVGTDQPGNAGADHHHMLAFATAAQLQRVETCRHGLRRQPQCAEGADSGGIATDGGNTGNQFSTGKSHRGAPCIQALWIAV